MRSLRTLLGHMADAVIPQMAHLVHDYRQSQRGSRSGANTKREIEQTIRALHRVVGRIDRLSPEAVARLDTPRMSDLLGHDSTRQLLLKTCLAAAESIVKLEALLGTPLTTGRPRSVDRDYFTTEVAIVLRLNGMRVAASRDGTFGRILATLLGEIEPSPPTELFPVIQPAADWIGRMTQEQLREVVRRFGEISGSRFWKDLSVVH